MFAGNENLARRARMGRLHFLRVFCCFINRFSHATDSHFWWCECFVVILQSSGVGVLVASGRKNGGAWWLCWKCCMKGEIIRRTLQGDGRNWKLWVLLFCKLRVKRGRGASGCWEMKSGERGCCEQMLFLKRVSVVRRSKLPSESEEDNERWQATSKQVVREQAGAMKQVAKRMGRGGERWQATHEQVRVSEKQDGVRWRSEWR